MNIFFKSLNELSENEFNSESANKYNSITDNNKILLNVEILKDFDINLTKQFKELNNFINFLIRNNDLNNSNNKELKEQIIQIKNKYKKFLEK